MLRKYVYHYHAFTQPEPGKLLHMDGMILMVHRVADADGMDRVRALVASVNAEAEPRSINIASLTYLGRESWRAALRR